MGVELTSTVCGGLVGTGAIETEWSSSWAPVTPCWTLLWSLLLLKLTVVDLEYLIVNGAWSMLKAPCLFKRFCQTKNFCQANKDNLNFPHQRIKSAQPPWLKGRFKKNTYRQDFWRVFAYEFKMNKHCCRSGCFLPLVEKTYQRKKDFISLWITINCKE